MNGIANNNSSEVCGTCTFCGKKSESKCDRCGDFYCSEDCQKKDWPSHRFICLPMPKLVKVGQNRFSESAPCQLAPKDAKILCSSSVPNGSCVLLTSIKSPNRCYIRSTNPSIVAEHEKVISIINEYGKTSTPFFGKVTPKSIALTTKSGKWYRVEILGKDRDNRFRVYFIDSGEINKRTLKELRKIDNSLLNLPCFVQEVQLKGVTDSINPKLSKLLYRYTNKEYKVVFHESGKGDSNVELFQWGSSVLLNSLIQDVINKYKDGSNDDDVSDGISVSSSCNVQPVKNELSDKKDHNKKAAEDINHTASKIQTNLKLNSPKNADSKSAPENMSTGLVASNPKNKKKSSVPSQIQTPCLHPPFDIIPLNENDTSGTVMIMDCSYIESGYIGCLSDKYLENLKAVTKFLSEYEIGDQSYKPKVNEYCLANYEHEWYRAKVVEIISENKYLVVYIDFTNEMEVTSESIRRYPMTLTLPCCTSLCSIEGLPEDISAEQKKFLESNLSPFQPLTIESIRADENVIYVKSNELLKKMCDAKLL